MSSLPTVDDLQSKARSTRNGLTLDLRSPITVNRPLLVTPASVLQEQQESSTCVSSLFRNCTTVFQCTRYKSDLPSYRPLHRQMSTQSSVSTRFLGHWRGWSERGKFCLLVASVLLSTLAFWSGMVVWNVISAWSERMRIATLSSSSSRVTTRQWYSDATFYEIFPASYLDTDGDGYGDFEGIIQKLDYIQSLGVSGIRFNSIFSALDYPLEYEHVIDLQSADPHLGKEADFRRMVREAHRRDLKVVLDLNPTLTSDQHTWALHWQRGIAGYEHFYASANRSKAPPEMENSEGPSPEDWELTQRTFGGHYLLNWSNPMVQEEFQRAIDHWIELGVDGFYMKHLENMQLLSPEDMPSIIHGWRKRLDHRRSDWNHHQWSRKVLIVSSKFADYLAQELGHSKLWRRVLRDVDLLDCPILVGSGQEMADQVSGLRKVSGWTEGSPVPMWHLGSADTFRLASRIEPRYQEAALFLLMALPGANSVFYGDEIGLRDSYDIFSGRVFRAGQLAPMQWTSDNSSGGFTDNATHPWLPLNPDHMSTNVESRISQLREFTRILHFRQTALRGYGVRDQRVDVLDPNVLVLERSVSNARNRKRILLAANFGNVSEEKEFPDSYGNVRVLTTTSGPTRTRVRTRSFTLSPGAAFLAEVTLLQTPHVNSRVG